MGLIQNTLAMLAGWFSWWYSAFVQLLPEGLHKYLIYKVRPTQILLTEAPQLESFAETLTSDQPIAWQLDGELTLVRKFSIPTAAKRDVSKIVALESERVLPLPADHLVYAIHTEAKTSDKEVSVSIAAARRTLVDRVFAVCKRRGVVIDSISVLMPEHGARVPLKFVSLLRKNITRAAIVMVSLLSMMMILGFLPALYADRLETEISTIDNMVATKRNQTEEIAGLQQQVQVLQGLYQAVYSERRGTSVLGLLKALTEHSPDGIVFEDIRLDGNRLFAIGIAVTPEVWVLDLERAPAFENVSLSSVIGLANQEGKRFELRLDYVPEERRPEP